MKAILRSAVLAAGVASTIALSTTGASAAGAGVFVGTAEINCFGCGTSTGTADLWITGALVTTAPSATPVAAVFGVTPPNATATYTVSEPPGATCVVQGTASGNVSGAVNVSFNWTRVGAVAVISTAGDINGAGVAAFKVTSPVGVPCGGPVAAQVVGAVAGA